MRSLLAGERTTIQGANVGHLPKVEITNADGTWIDYSAYAIVPQWAVNMDQPVATGTVTLRRAAGTASLAPLMAASTLNVNGALAYAPAIDIGRLIRISTATHTIGGALTYREVFTGRVDAVEWAQDPIEVAFSDLGGWLMDTQIKVERGYGSEAGTAVETILQQIVTDNPDGGPAVTLYTPVSPGWNLHALTQARVKVLEALRAFAVDGIGWDVRYRYDALHASRLTFYDPDRDRVSVDTTIGPTEYTDVRRLSLSLADVRNDGRVVYVDTTGAEQEALDDDAASISKYRRRYFELTAPDAIDTVTEATLLVEAIVNDLSGAPAEQEIEMLYFWPVQLYDRYTFTANGVHYDTDQTLTVVGYSHSFENGTGTTTLTCTGRVVGAYARWLKQIVSAVGNSANEIRDLTRTDSVDGLTSTFSFTLGSGVDSVWVGAVTVTAPEQSTDWDAAAAAVVPLASGVLTYTVTRPRDGTVVLLQFEPRDANLTAGTVRRVEITATPQVPHVEVDDLETGTVGTQWWKLTERGIAVTLVQVQTQIGITPISGWSAPTRGPDDASTVRGGVLGVLEYEQDVDLDPTRQSWVVPRHYIENTTAPIVLGPFGFDRDKNPNLGPVTIDDALHRYVTIVGDVDTKSVGLYSTTRGWKYEVDGTFATIDVQAAGTSASGAGLAAATSDTFTAKAWAEPVADIVGGTLYDARDILAVNGAGAAAASLSIVTAFAPGGGSDVATIKLKASAAPGGWTIRVFIAESIVTTNPVPTVNETANLTPVPSAPPTVETTYSWTSDYSRPLSGGSRLVTLKVKAELVLAGVVQDTKSATASWYTGAL